MPRPGERGYIMEGLKKHKTCRERAGVTLGGWITLKTERRHKIRKAKSSDAATWTG